MSGGIQWTTKGMLFTIATLLEAMWHSLNERQADGIAEMMSTVVDAPELATLPLQREGLREWITFLRTPSEWGDTYIGASGIQAMRRDLEATRDALDKPHLFQPLEASEARASA